MRSSPTGQLVSTGFQNGRVLQTWVGTPTVSDFTFNSGTPTSSGYPANSASFVKLRPESLLRFVVNCDITGPSSPPDTVWIGIYIDGVDKENLAAAAPTVGEDLFSKSIILDGVTLAAGSHTLLLYCWDTQSKSCTLRCSTSCDFTVVEYLP